MFSTHRAPYQVTLPVFQGPLDLLLQLIERQELDITLVSLARVTSQFLEHMAQLTERDPDSLADFLVVAAKLLVIKSRVLLPQPPIPAPLGEEDVGEDLLQQLIEYRKYKQAAQWLKDVEAQGLQSFVRVSAAPHPEHTLDLGDLTLHDLLAAFREALQIKAPEPSVNGTIPPLTISIADQMNLITQAIQRGRSVSLISLIRQTAGRLEVIVTLLALLEMVKQGLVSMRQDLTFGDILVSARDNGRDRSSAVTPSG